MDGSKGFEIGSEKRLDAEQCHLRVVLGLGCERQLQVQRLCCRSVLRTSSGKDYVTLDDVFDAYWDCRRHKRNKRSAVEYELRYELNNEELWMELNNRTYKPATSLAFCVRWPKVREVFAADFRDRIVHHLFIGKVAGEVERRLTDSAYACRKDKGTLYGVRRVARAFGRYKEPLQSRSTRDGEDDGGWYAKCDIEGFFMSIDKGVLWVLVKDVVMGCEDIPAEDKEWWLWLGELLVKHKPEEDCRRQGDLGLWDLLPKEKSLFCSDGKGLPIGNLTSQVFANLYMAAFDDYMLSLVGDNGFYGRYADDFIIVHEEKRVVLDAVKKARMWLQENRGLTLHSRKLTVQRVRRGVTFTGYRIKGGRIFAGKRIMHNAMRVIGWWNKKENHTADDRRRLRDRYNSYQGMMRHTRSWQFRRKMWRGLTDYEGIININNKKIKVRL